jgi:hypothetical protein
MKIGGKEEKRPLRQFSFLEGEKMKGRDMNREIKGKEEMKEEGEGR